MRALVALLLCLAALACGSDPAAAGGGGSGGWSDGSAGSGGKAAGLLDCAGVLLCAEKCQDSDCIGACKAASDPEAWDAAYALAKCAVDHDCADSSCPECAAQRDACLYAGLATLSCASLGSCIEVCGGDSACVQDVCMRRAEPGAAEAYEALQACVAQYGCTDASCVQLNCAREQDDCYGS